jgi:hypothetical protein
MTHFRPVYGNVGPNRQDLINTGKDILFVKIRLHKLFSQSSDHPVLPEPIHSEADNYTESLIIQDII